MVLDNSNSKSAIESGTVGTVCLHAVAIGIVLFVIGVGVPRYAMAVADSEFTISAMTLWTVQFGHFVAKYGYLIGAVLILANSVIILQLSKSDQHSRRSLWTTLVLSSLLGLVAFCCLSLCLVINEGA
jgi:type II secretory pathway component PulF